MISIVGVLLWSKWFHALSKSTHLVYKKWGWIGILVVAALALLGVGASYFNRVIKSKYPIFHNKFVKVVTIAILILLAIVIGTWIYSEISPNPIYGEDTIMIFRAVGICAGFFAGIVTFFMIVEWIFNRISKMYIRFALRHRKIHRYIKLISKCFKTLVISIVVIVMIFGACKWAYESLVEKPKTEMHHIDRSRPIRTTSKAKPKAKPKEPSSSKEAIFVSTSRVAERAKLKSTDSIASEPKFARDPGNASAAEQLDEKYKTKSYDDVGVFNGDSGGAWLRSRKN